MKKIKFANYIPQALGILFLVFLAVNWDKAQISANILSGAQDKAYIGQEVVYYGKILNISTSGSLKFTFYYPRTGVFDDSKNGWFWANLDFNNKQHVQFLELIGQNYGATFKITGIRKADDADYYEGLPVKDIDVKNIEIFKQ